eukprot:3813214-Rhodomonas_salina.4
MTFSNSASGYGILTAVCFHGVSCVCLQSGCLTLLCEQLASKGTQSWQLAEGILFSISCIGLELGQITDRAQVCLVALFDANALIRSRSRDVCRSDASVEMRSVSNRRRSCDESLMMTDLRAEN